MLPCIVGDYFFLFYFGGIFSLRHARRRSSDTMPAMRAIIGDKNVHIFLSP